MAWVTAFAASQCGNRMYRVKAGGRTFRTVVRLPFGGEKLRLTLASMYGTDLHIGSMSVTACGKTGKVSVNGKNSFTVRKNERVLTDEIMLPVPDGAEVEIRTFFSKGFFQSGLWQPTEYSVPGDFTDAAFVSSGDDLWVSSKRPFDIGMSLPAVAGIEVSSPAQDTQAIAVLGASNEFLGRWIKPLREKLAAADPHTALLDFSISGNRLMKDTGNKVLVGNLFGDRASKRFSEEILGFSGIKTVILSIGGNDIFQPHTFACYPWEKVPDASELRSSLEALIAKAHMRGMKVIGTTITPGKKANGCSDDKLAVRNEVNEWMKGFDGYDALFDLASVIQSKEDPDVMEETYNSGDYIHFNAAGGQAIADAFPIKSLRG